MAQDELRPGFIHDFISGKQVKATSEELEAVQVFARRIVKDYGYSKAQITTRPQFRVRKRPSDEAKSYPVDIAVFKTNQKTEESLFLIVECKKKNSQDGLSQLKLYMDMSPAEVGVWFNGDEHIYLRKIHHVDGSRTYENIPSIPSKGQRIEDIGLFKRKDLTKPSNLKSVFKDIRNHLAGMTTGITRDEALAQEIINILFCKILDEQETEPDDTVSFRVGIGETHQTVNRRILDLFNKVRKHVYDDVFAENDTIHLDEKSLSYVVGELQNYCMMDADRDAIGEAFEVFIGPALRGSEGQFFTPRNVVRMVVDILNPMPGERIIDPACGSGGFLIAALEHVWRHLREEGKRKNWQPRQLIKREVDIATNCFRGIDKDAFLAKVCKAYMALVGDGRGGVFCENALIPETDWPAVMKDKISLGTFDIVMTNPPFGKKIVVRGEDILSQFELGRKWKKNKITDEIEMTDAIEDSKPPQLLFLERCIQFLKPGGRLGIVLPESILGNPSYEYIMVYLEKSTVVEAIITLPEPLFKTSGKGGTHCKVCVLIARKKKAGEGAKNIFMADAKWCGHDSRGNPTIRKSAMGKEVVLDDIPKIADRYDTLVRKGQKKPQDHLGFLFSPLHKTQQILVPKYYNPTIKIRLNELKKHMKLFHLGLWLVTALFPSPPV